MSKDIWHTADEAPKPYEDVAFYVDGYLYFSSYEPQYNQYGIFGADKVEKWCYSKELSSYILALETELERTRKALDVALCSLQDIAESDGDFITGASTPLDEHEYADMMLKEIKRQMKIKTALEQKDVK